MANELSMGFSLGLSKSGGAITRGYNAQVNVAGIPYSAGVGEVTLAGTYVDLGSVGTIGQVAISHIAAGSTASYIKLGTSGGDWPVKLWPGEFFVGRWNLAAIHVLPDTGSANFEWTVVSA